jgi:hypothetical protein
MAPTAAYLGFLLPTAMHHTSIHGTDWFARLEKESVSPHNHEIKNHDEFVFSVVHNCTSRQLTTITDWLFQCIDAKRDEYYPYQRDGLTFVLHKSDWELYKERAFSSALNIVEEQYCKEPLLGSDVATIYVKKTNMRDFINSFESHYRMHYGFSNKPYTGRPNISSDSSSSRSTTSTYSHSVSINSTEALVNNVFKAFGF